MSAKTFLIILLAMCCLISCNKNKNTNLSSDQIVLSALKVSGTTVSLSWSKLNNDSLAGYVIVKVVDSTNSLGMTYINVDKSATQYTDTLPMAPYVQYYITAELSSPYARSIASNKETYARTDISLMSISPMDAVLDRSSQELYIYSATG